MRTTMADIARECGVTKMTVSRVLSGRVGVKDSTRDKVMEAAQRLRYEINFIAKNLNSNRSGFIGVATPFSHLLGSSYFAEAFQGFCEAIKDSGLDFALFDTNSSKFNDGEKLAKLYRQRRVDGLLFVALHTTDHFVKVLRDQKVPMVIVGEKPTCPEICSVSCNDYSGVKQLCSYLYSLGHERIAFVSGPDEYATANRRKRAYTDFCRSKGLKNPAWYLHPGDFSLHGAMAAADEVLTREPRPTAVIGANDTTAYGLLEGARARGLRVPEDISIAGFDDLPTEAERWLGLTTVRQPVRKIGEESARILVDAIEHGTLPSGHLVLDVELVVRESTGRAKRRR